MCACSHQGAHCMGRYVCMCVSAYVCVCVSVLCMCVCVYSCVYLCNVSVSVHVCVSVHVYMSVCICVVYVYLCVYMLVCVCVVHCQILTLDKIRHVVGANECSLTGTIQCPVTSVKTYCGQSARPPTVVCPEDVSSPTHSS